MRVLVQRTTNAEVRVGKTVHGKIGNGLLILLGITHSDSSVDVDFLTTKCAHLRVFEDKNSKMNLSLLDISGEAMVISQFTLYGDASHGRRPGYSEAAPPEQAEPLYQEFISKLQKLLPTPVAHGVFGAEMAVDFVNDGPVTLLVESPK